MTKDWIKLHTKILHDSKIGRLPPTLWRLYIELQLIAGSHPSVKDGYLPDVLNIGWILHRSPHIPNLEADLEKLSKRALIVWDDAYEGWLLPNFELNQGPLLFSPYPSDWETIRAEILKRDDRKCLYCGLPATHVDHILPVNDGGNHHHTNLASACERCNKSKKDRGLVPWYKSQPFYDPLRLDYVLSILINDKV